MASRQDQADALTALFTLITNTANELDKSGVHVSSRATAARDLALAYRHALGGPQPGGVTVQKD